MQGSFTDRFQVGGSATIAESANAHIAVGGTFCAGPGQADTSGLRAMKTPRTGAGYPSTVLLISFGSRLFSSE